MASSYISESDHGMKFPELFFSKTGKTFQYDESRPVLPVPPLQQTLRKYIENVKPHLTEEEFEETKKIVEDFAYGQGRELHALLLDKSKYKKNWLEKWWEEQGYLATRVPHNPYVSFSGPAPYVLNNWPPEEGSQIKRGALVMWCSLKYWQLLYKEKLTIDRGGMKEKNFWSMSQFRRMFNSCKIPGEKMDQFKFHFKTESEGPPIGHIIVLCRGRIFKMTILDGQGEPLRAPELEQQLQYISNKCEGEPFGPGLGALTGHNRTEFYRARKHLLEIHPDHKHNMDVIEKAMFAFTLDDNEPDTITEICRSGLIGDSRNRWFDKSMTHIIFKNGVASCNCDIMAASCFGGHVIKEATFEKSQTYIEHAPHDAMIMVSGTLWNQLSIELNMGQWKGPTDIRSLPGPEELLFHLDSRMYMYIEEAIRVFKAVGDSIELLSSFYTGYGRKLMRKLGVHPDTHCQVAAQYAYYKLYGRPAATYETASTRKYYNARTETCRSCTVESCEFAKAMLNENTTKEQRLRCLKAAYDKHIETMIDCQNAMGIDRHLFGLQMVAAEEGMDTPNIFTDPAWKKSGGGGNFTLSTSFVGYTDVYGGVAPMCKDGYGYFYAIQNDRISYWITTWKADHSTNAKMFYDTVCKCLDEMRTLLEYGAEEYSKSANL